MKKLIILLILCLTTTVYAADTKTTALGENTTVADADIMYIVDDVAGTPTSQKITVLNLFDTIDTSLKLLTILTNETGTGALVFAISPTLVTPILGTIVSGVGTALTALNGENIQDDTIDDDSIDWADCTFADFDFETAWKMWHSDAAGDVTEITLGADGTFLESNGAAANPAFRALVDGDIPDDITVDLATLATTVTLGDDDATNDNQDIVFTTDAAGAVNLEADIGDFYYNPSTGTVTATEFVGGGTGLTGFVTAYDDIGDPDAASSITFADGETVTWATSEDSAGPFFLIQNSDADLAANTYLLDLDYSVDDDQANADYLRCQDAGGVVFSIQQNGDTVSTGTIQGTTLTGTAIVGPSFDAAGAEDMDYGSADVTDHTFTTDDSTFIIDGGITVSTGDVITLGTTQWNSADEIDGTKIKDADYGDVDVSAGGAWTLDTDSVADNEIDYANVTFADFDYETAWKMWHSDAAGDVTEITLGADGTFLESNGAAAAPAFRVLATGDIPDISATYEVQLTNEAGLYGVLADVTDFLQSGDIDGTGELAGITDYETGSGALVFGTAPTFTTSITLTGANASPGAAGNIRYDNVVAGLDGGALVYYDDDEVKHLMDYVTAPTDAEDDYHLAYDKDTDLMYWKADADTGGTPTVITVADTVDATSFVALWESATGDLEPKSDLGLTYAADTGTLSSTVLTEGGIAVYNDDEMDEFSELDAIVTDKSLVNLEDGGTFTGNIIANANLSVGNAGTTAGVLTLLEDDDDGAHFASFMVPALDASTVYTLPPDDGDDTEVLQTNGGGTLTWVSNAAGGAVAWDDITDPDLAATIDFVTYTQTIDIGVTDDGGPKSGLILDVTGLGAGTDDVIALEITTATDDDEDYIPIAIYDDSGVANDLLFYINSYGDVYSERRFVVGNSCYLEGEVANTIAFTGSNADTFKMLFGGTDIGLIWSDGALNLRNAEDGVDAIVNIQGKDADEKGILRVLSDGDDKYIQMYHADDNAYIEVSSGSLDLASQGVILGTITGTINAGGATLTMPKRTANDNRYFAFNMISPNLVYDVDTQFIIEPNLPAAITITEVTVTCDADPATELDWDLKWADAFIGLGGATLVVAIDTTNGAADVDAGFNDATVAAGKCLYVEFAADPDAGITQVMVKVRYDYD